MTTPHDPRRRPKPGAPRPGSPAAQAQAARAQAEVRRAQERPKPGPRRTVSPQEQVQEPAQAEAHSHAPKNVAGAQETAVDGKGFPAEEARREAIANFPFVALTIQSTGIHPSTGRIVTMDAVTFNASGEIGQDFHAIVSSDMDPGPRHQHGLGPEELSQGQPFSKLLKPLDRLIDGRTLVVHDTSYTWGFIVAAARRTMTAAARQNRARNRNRSRGRGRRRRHKVGHVPTPVAIIDTLAGARRQGIQLTDIRLAAVALASGLQAEPPTATVARAQRPETETSRAATRLLLELSRAQEATGHVVRLDPENLRADRFGLQRSTIRVDAAEAPRLHHNPGPYTPGKELRRGMEVVIAPDIEMDPDEIIAALTTEELNYSEKLTRETSVVVCNVTTDLVGKPMHAHRKGIPLMSDTAFMAALERVQEALPAPKEKERQGAHVPNSNNRRGNSGRRRKPRKDQGAKTEGKRRRRGGRGRNRRNSGGNSRGNTDS